MFAHGNDAGDLDRRENSVVVITLDRAQCLDHLAIARAEPHSPAGHVVALAHRRELNAQILCARGTEKTGRSIPIKTNLPIRKIADDHHLMPPAHLNGTLPESRLDG